MWLIDNLRRNKPERGPAGQPASGNPSKAGSEIFSYKGYLIPVELVNLTGGGVDTWDEISLGHQDQLHKYCPITPDADMLEVGCGVGRDAIQLTEFLSDAGSYTGIDIIRPSIEWCQNNISTRHSNFRFHYLDIESQIHNAGGSLKTTDVALPVAGDSIDRIILHSVFTHMFEEDIVHYLHEFHRVLRTGGQVMASFFYLDDETLGLIQQRAQGDAGVQNLTFNYDYGNGCFVNDEEHPEGAVGYIPEAFDRILQRGRMKLVRPVAKGFWCGREGVTDGQDMAILEPE